MYMTAEMPMINTKYIVCVFVCTKQTNTHTHTHTQLNVILCKSINIICVFSKWVCVLPLSPRCQWSTEQGLSVRNPSG